MRQKKGSDCVKGRRNETKASAWTFLAVMPLCVLWMELVFRFVIAEHFFGVGLWLTALFTIPTGLLVSLLCTFGKPKLNHAITVGLLAVIALVICSQIVYYGVFETFYTVFSVKNVGQVMQFWKDTLLSIWRNLLSSSMPFSVSGWLLPKRCRGSSRAWSQAVWACCMRLRYL